MHLPVDKDALARVVSARLATRNENEYRYQEDCGASDTTSFFRLVKKSDIHNTVLIGVTTSITTDDFEKQLLERRFDQNVAFLSKNNAHHAHPLCPSVLAIGQPHEDFAYSWVAYADIHGWPLASTWHQLKPEIRQKVVENIAIFVRELARISTSESPSEPSVDYVGSTNENHIVFPPALAASSAYWLNNRELDGVTGYSELVALLGENRAAMLDMRAKDAGTKSLVAKQIRAILPVAVALLVEPYEAVLAHMNLLPQNIWIDPFSGKVNAVFGWEYAHYAPVWMATAPLGWLMNEKREWMLESEKMGDPWGVWRSHFDHPPENTAKEMKQLQDIWDESLTSGEGVPCWTTGGQWGERDDKLRRTALKVCFVEEQEMPKAVSWAWCLSLNSTPDVFKAIFLAYFVLLAAAYVIVYGTRTIEVSNASRDDSGRQHRATIEIFIGVVLLVCFFVQQYRRNNRLSKVAGWIPHFGRREAAGILRDLLRVRFMKSFSRAFGYAGPAKGKGRAKAKEFSAVPCSPANSIVPAGIYVPSFLSRAATMISRAPTEMGEEK